MSDIKYKIVPVRPGVFHIKESHGIFWKYVTNPYNGGFEVLIFTSADDCKKWIDRENEKTQNEIKENELLENWKAENPDFIYP